MVHNSEAKIFDNNNQIVRAPVTRTISKFAATMIGRLLLSRACPLKGPSLPHDLWLPLSRHMFRVRNVRDSESAAMMKQGGHPANQHWRQNRVTVQF